MKIKTEAIEIPLEAGGTMGGFVARPDDREARPAVLVFMEIFGINSHIRDVAERLAREGYVALAPDYFHRTGPGVEYAYDEEGMGRGMALLAALEADEMISDVNAAIAWLESRSDVQSERIGAIGFCIGGHMAYLSACETSVCSAARSRRSAARPRSRAGFSACSANAMGTFPRIRSKPSRRR
jgi:carboxymethylenebutenolidase